MSSEDPHAIELLHGAPYGRLALSRHALPFITVTRHIVVDGAVLIRIHRGFGYHTSCDGSVVAYEADNVDTGASDVWSVQFVGTARLTEPSLTELERFGALSASADGEPYDPAYLRIEPQFATVHRLTGVPETRPWRGRARAGAGEETSRPASDRVSGAGHQSQKSSRTASYRLDHQITSAAAAGN